MLRRSFLATIAVFGLAASANARAYVFLDLDPPTTAGAGVPPAGGFSVQSSRGGCCGTWHLFAVDDVEGSFGIRSYSVTLSNTSTFTHRSPTTSWDDNPTFGNGSGPFTAGFSDSRSGSNVNPIVASQGLANSPQIGGFGITASNFQAKTGGQSYSGTVNGQWGNYADPFTDGTVYFSGRVRSAVFLAEGFYGMNSARILSASVEYYTNAELTQSAFADIRVNVNPFLAPEPGTLSLLGLALAGGLGLTRRRRR